MIPGDEHNVLDPPTEVIAHLPHPIHNLVWFALRKVREGSQAPHDTCRDWRRPIERIKTLRLHPVESESFDFRPDPLAAMLNEMKEADDGRNVKGVTKGKLR